MGEAKRTRLIFLGFEREGQTARFSLASSTSFTPSIPIFHFTGRRRWSRSYATLERA